VCAFYNYQYQILISSCCIYVLYVFESAGRVFEIVLCTKSVRVCRCPTRVGDGYVKPRRVSALLSSGVEPQSLLFVSTVEHDSHFTVESPYLYPG